MKLKFISLITLLLALVIVSVVFGTVAINPFSGELSPAQQSIIFDLRIPRTVVALLCGATLASSGLIMQVLLKNDLADSSILGFQSGATLMAMVVILVFPNMTNFLPLFAFVGGLLSFGIVAGLNTQKKGSMYLVLIGIAINAMIGAMIGFLSILFSDYLENTLSYTNGSLASITKQEMYNVVFYATIALILTLSLHRRIGVFELEDIQIQNLGIKVNKTRFVLASLSVFLSSISVAFVGIIGFVGLVAPHICRIHFSRKLTYLLPSSILMGSTLVLGSDVVQRILFPYYEIPVGTIMSLLGGIFFLIILMRSNNA